MRFWGQKEAKKQRKNNQNLLREKTIQPMEKSGSITELKIN